MVFNILEKGGLATNDDHYDLYKNLPENDHGRDGRFLKKIVAELEKGQKCTLQTAIYDHLRPLVQNFA